MKDLDNNDSLDKEEFSGGSIGKMRERSDSEFERKDLNGDAKLTVDEFLAAANWTEEERQVMRREDFKREDKDEDGELSREQFIGNKEGVNKRYAEEMFAVLDRDKDGSLNEGEYADRANLWDFPRIQFQYRDSNRDGELSLEEFIVKDIGKSWESSRRSQFSVFDVDRNRKLSIDEFDKLETEATRRRVLSKLPKEQRLLATYDLDRDNLVTARELTVVLAGEGKTPEHAEQLFSILDGDGDKQLEQTEINRLSEKTPQIEFAIRDVDGSGTLTLAEQIGDSRGKPHEKWRRLHFDSRDTDYDGVLSMNEYSIPDGDRRMLFVQRDANKDGELTLEEQLAGVVGTQYEEWRRLNFRGHDLDRDGITTREEFIIDDKDPRIDFSRRDADGDGIVTLDEHVAKNLGNPGEKWDRIFFRSHDFDDSGTLSLDEFSVSKDDIRVKFGEKDEDGDGSLSQAEFLANAIGKKWEPHARRTFQLHDQDENGSLSLNEFTATDEEAAEERRIRGLPPEERGFARLDKSRDSRLSEDEFASRHGESSFVQTQEKRYFRVLDRDRNGSLDLNEFLSKDEPIPQVIFAKRDADGDAMLTFEEYARWIPPQAQQGEQVVFDDYDQDKDAALSPEEFIRLENGRSGRERWAWIAGLIGSPMNWLTVVIVIFDVLLVFLIGRAVIRRLHGKNKQPAATDVASES
ncbi:Calsymin [Rhodopirellula islandica]|uniref:Calsymin n=1 Tax=Rhodopirellula islandica TaxID=595434 RepID=A0A0J1B6T1_RHOIS|nr:Calsymin [Rhodopirellula islandica]